MSYAHAEAVTVEPVLTYILEDGLHSFRGIWSNPRAVKTWMQGQVAQVGLGVFSLRRNIWYLTTVPCKTLLPLSALFQKDFCWMKKLLTLLLSSSLFHCPVHPTLYTYICYYMPVLSIETISPFTLRLAFTTWKKKKKCCHVPEFRTYN